MKRIDIFFIFCLVISVNEVLSQSWTLIPSGTNCELQQIQFISNLTGFTVCSNGTILKTTDGGQNFIPLTNPASYRFYFLDSLTGFSVGSDIYKTTDGGQNWQSKLAFSNPEFPRALSFVSDDTGYVAVDRISDDSVLIYKTVDGGENWLIQSGLLSGPTTSFYFSDNNNGFIGNIYFHWQVTRNSLIQDFYDTLYLNKNEEKIYQIDY